MAHIEATSSGEVQAFLQANGGVAVVDLFATWCGPCKAIKPYVDKLNQELKIPLVAVDVDKSAELSQAYGVTAMPTFLVIKDNWNNVVEKVIGGGQANVDKVYNKAKSLK